MSEEPIFADRMLSLGLARVSEQAAIAAAKLVGRGDEKAADQAAVDAMRTQLNSLDIDGVVVIGEGERDEAPMLYIGEEVGRGGPKVDIALDPLEGTTIAAKAMQNSLAVIAIGESGCPAFHAGHAFVQRPQRTQVSASKSCFQLKSCSLPAPRLAPDSISASKSPIGAR